MEASVRGKAKGLAVLQVDQQCSRQCLGGQVKLVDQLLLPAFGADAREAERNRTRAALALQAKHRMLVIAPLASFT